jgi:alkyldihydroxyacetonephosphate synthase
VPGVLSCRFTHVYPDGPAPYYTFLAPGRRGEEIAQWSAIKRAVSDAIVANGGTITHHHAVGRRHRDHWARGEADPLFVRALGRVKEELDPAGVLNPGVLLPPK